MARKTLFFILLALIFGNSTCFPAILAVPDNYPSISAAIGLAEDGDTILVRPGTYKENPRIEQKSLLLTSEFLYDSSFSSIEATIIDGSDPSDAQKGSTVTAATSLADGSGVMGFTITGGVGTFLGDRYAGGGVLILDCPNVSIAHNLIVDNAATYGGGLTAYNCGPKVEHNVIIDNSATYAGGIDLVGSQAVVMRNVLYANDATYSGGGICVSESGSAIFNDNVVMMNSADVGGGISCESDSPQIAYNCFWQNTGGDFSACDDVLGDTTCCINYNRVPCDTYSNVFRNPGFVNTEENDFTVLCSSAVIDAGSKINPDKPIGGKRTDIGLLEYEYSSGDFNGVDLLDIDDLVLLIDYIYHDGNAACPLLRADFNCDGKINSLDISLTIAYLFRGGTGPCDF